MNVKTRFFSSKLLLLLILLFCIPLTSCTESSTTSSAQETTTNLDQCSISMILEVSNGIAQIETEYVVCETVTDVYSADGFCMIYDFVDNYSALPSLEQTSEMTIIKDSDINISTIEVYDSEGTLIDTWDSWEDREILETGQYYVSFHINRSEDNCMKSGYSFFVLTVQ